MVMPTKSKETVIENILKCNVLIDGRKYNVLIDGRNFHDQPINDQIEKYDEIRKTAVD